MFNFSDLTSFVSSKTALFYILVGFLFLVIVATSALLYHWAKYAKEVDTKYKIMELIYVVGIIFIMMVCLSSYLMI